MKEEDNSIMETEGGRTERKGREGRNAPCLSSCQVEDSFSKGRVA